MDGRYLIIYGVIGLLSLGGIYFPPISRSSRYPSSWKIIPKARRRRIKLRRMFWTTGFV